MAGDTPKSKIESFKDLFAWQEGRLIVLAIYKITRQLPKEEVFGLVSQMRRSAISITSNIVEGFGRKGKNDKIQFYKIAIGSLFELQNQLTICKDLQYLDKSSYEQIDNHIIKENKIICGLINKLQ